MEASMHSLWLNILALIVCGALLAWALWKR
jgi:hypothetical protein